ncbi:winged helix-turn-helix transcriptional regulator [Streptomyces sp. NPDC058653]|uniref:winged helix-turn-helix transcriptional regulator n=1 Tax=Streptomyces sp. NPDC058653 TaxID=3346576 RepID=UPI003655BD73
MTAAVKKLHLDAAPVDQNISRAFDLLGTRWTGPVISVLLQGPCGFSALHRAVPGISQRMLSNRLAALVDAGVVVREVHAGPPLRVAYQVTEAGAALDAPLRKLSQWAGKHLRSAQA